MALEFQAHLNRDASRAVCARGLLGEGSPLLAREDGAVDVDVDAQVVLAELGPGVREIACPKQQKGCAMYVQHFGVCDFERRIPRKMIRSPALRMSFTSSPPMSNGRT